MFNNTTPFQFSNDTEKSELLETELQTFKFSTNSNFFHNKFVEVFLRTTVYESHKVNQIG